MPKKQAIVKETAAVATPARAAKPKTPRVKTARHSKVVSAEMSGAETIPENPHDVIEQMAYGYWEAGGHQSGAALEDWLRAEHDYRQRQA